jgi:predicted nucleic acid-binding protein
MILAAHALAEGAAIVTSNVKHLSRLVVAMDWSSVPVS